MNSKRERRFKLVVLGTTGVGKTCLTLRFAKGVFDEEQLPTIGAAYMTKKLSLSRTPSEVSRNNDSGNNSSDDQLKEDFVVEIWDTAGQERYEAITPLYYRSSEAAVIVFDLTSQHSFQKAKEWLQRLRKERPDPSMPICLAGNKYDLYEKLTKKKKDLEASLAQTQQPDGQKLEETQENEKQTSALVQNVQLDFEVVDEAEVLEFTKGNNLKYYRTSAKTGLHIDDMFQYLALNLPRKEERQRNQRLNQGLPLGTNPDSETNNCC